LLSVAGDLRFGWDGEQARPYSPRKRGCPIGFISPPITLISKGHISSMFSKSQVPQPSMALGLVGLS